MGSVHDLGPYWRTVGGFLTVFRREDVTFLVFVMGVVQPPGPLKYPSGLEMSCNNLPPFFLCFL
jgi:hypothetical protein